MVDYYKAKREFMSVMNQLLVSEKGKVLKVSSLEREIGLKFGFGRLAIMRVLLNYEKAGYLIFYRYKTGKNPSPDDKYGVTFVSNNALEDFEVL